MSNETYTLASNLASRLVPVAIAIEKNQARCSFSNTIFQLLVFYTRFFKRPTVTCLFLICYEAFFKKELSAAFRRLRKKLRR